MKCSTKMCFHGSFADKERAKEREREVRGFIRRVTVKGRTRFLVLTNKHA